MKNKPDGGPTDGAVTSYVPLVEPARVAELRRRLTQVMPPSVPDSDDWSFGTPTPVLRPLLDRWQTFDADALAGALGRFEHYLFGKGDAAVHFVHRRSPASTAVPLLLVHGWPSSFLEFADVIGPLAVPSVVENGPTGGFHVVVPSLPGFLFSGKPAALADYRASAVADRLDQLMGGLGYERYLVSGTDIGARVASWLAARHPEHVLGVHLSTNALAPTPPAPRESPTSADPWNKAMAAWDDQEGGYHHLLRTRPTAAAWAFADSPAGMAAWVVEKWVAWSDDLDVSSDRVVEQLLSLLTLYWTTGSFPTTLFHYRAHDLEPGARPVGPLPVPTSVYASSADIGGIPPLEVVTEQLGTVRYTSFNQGGHFMASEQPDAFVRDLCGFAGAV